MLSVVKTDEQRRARELRALGWSVREIEAELGVARSSVSGWVRDVELDLAARARLVERARLGPLNSARRSRDRSRERRLDYQDQGRDLIRRRGASYIAGCMLFWAEGDKARNDVRMSNSDPDLLRTFADFLREHFDVRDEDFRVYCHLFADHLDAKSRIEQFWVDRLGLPPSCLRKSQVNVYSRYSQKKRRNTLPYGTCKLVVHSTQIVQTIYGSIQEYGGFDRPEWLD
jgi:transcriptional regulator with XRE-family HTH domain